MPLMISYTGERKKFIQLALIACMVLYIDSLYCDSQFSSLHVASLRSRDKHRTELNSCMSTRLGPEADS